MSLENGAPLVVEELDLSGLGLYTDEQKMIILSTPGAVDDFFLKTLFDTTLWARKSDEGVKWHVFEDSEIKLHKV